MKITENLPTIDELKADENLLRIAAGRVLETGPWTHCYHHDHGDVYICAKCRSVRLSPEGANTSCPVPYPATGSLSDIAERLVKMTTRRDLENAILDMYYHIRHQAADALDTAWVWFVYLSSDEQVILLLVALGKARIA